MDEHLRAARSDTSAWRNADPAWKREREARWHEIWARLRALAYESREMILLRDYYLGGVVPDRVMWQGKEIATVPLFFRLWFHPDVSDENWVRQLACTTWIDHRCSFSIFAAICKPAGGGIDGIERRMYASLVGSARDRTFRDDAYEHHGQRTTKDIVDLFARPEAGFRSLSATLELHGTGVVTIDRLMMRQRLEYADDIDWSGAFPPRKGHEHLLKLFDYVATGSYRKKLKGASPEAIAARDELAQELRDLFDEGIGPARFQELWQEHRARAAQTRGTSTTKAAPTKKVKAATVKEAPDEKVPANKAPKRKPTKAK